MLLKVMNTNSTNRNTHQVILSDENSFKIDFTETRKDIWKAERLLTIKENGFLSEVLECFIVIAH